MTGAPPPFEPTFVLRPVPAPLKPFVAAMWGFAASDFPHTRERVLPVARAQLLVNLEADALHWFGGPAFRDAHRIGGAGVSGAYDRPFAIDTGDQRRIVGVVFHPGGAGPLLGVPGAELAGAHVPLDALPGARHLRQRLLEAPRGQVLARLEAWLLTRVPGAAVDPAVGFALKRLDRGATVRDVARALDYSPRRLRRHFAAAVGLNPKRYAGLARFHRVVRRVAAGAPDSWADLALDAGYVDQAHLVRDFRAFSGLTPTQYRPRAPDEPNHVPLDEA